MVVGRRRQKRSATRARPIQARVESSNGSVLLLLLLYGRAAMRLLTAGARGRWMDGWVGGWIVYIIRVRPARCSDPIRCAPVSDGVARGLAAEKVWRMGGGWRAITQLLRSVRQQVTTDPKS